MTIAILLYLLAAVHNFILDGALSDDYIFGTNWWMVLLRSLCWPFVTIYMLLLALYVLVFNRFH